MSQGTPGDGTRRVVVVGGGLVGMASALFLSRAGWRVTLVERTSIGGGSSGSNCGLVCPSHVLPHAGHWVQIEQVDRFRTQAAAFFTES